jgi:site-specific DNA-methyltransferase (adenine-specific)
MSNIRIIHGDSLEAMKAMPDKAYELAICDPPYGIDIETHQQTMHDKRVLINGGSWKQYKNSGWDLAIPDEEYFNQLFRIAKNQIIWGGNYLLGYLPRTRCFLIWDKIQRDNRADAEIAWTSFDKPTKIFSYSRADAYINHCDCKIHPTQKPVALYQWLLKNYAKPGDKILDTHGGSCSIAIACDIMGFDADIWEIDEDYYRAAVERFERHKQQTVLEFK